MSRRFLVVFGAFIIRKSLEDEAKNLLELSQASERGLDSEVRLCPTASSADKRNSNVVLVSTLDGKLTALDPNDEGRMLWSIDTKPGDMVSSTIR